MRLKAINNWWLINFFFKDTVASSSAEECAKVCLDSAIIYDSPFKCLSFDYCSDDKQCAFYNSTHISDPSVVISSAPLCDHYSSEN